MPRNAGVASDDSALASTPAGLAVVTERDPLGTPRDEERLRNYDLAVRFFERH